MALLIKNLAVTAALLDGYGADVLHIDPPVWDESPNRTKRPHAKVCGSLGHCHDFLKVGLSLSPWIAITGFGNRVKRGINRPNLPFGGETSELPLHRVDPGEIDRDVVVAAAFVWHQLKTTAGEGCGRTSTAEMDDGSEILRLLQTRCRVWPACEYLHDIPVQVHRRKLDGMARHDAGIETC